MHKQNKFAPILHLSNAMYDFLSTSTFFLIFSFINPNIIFRTEIEWNCLYLCFIFILLHWKESKVNVSIKVLNWFENNIEGNFNFCFYCPKLDIFSVRWNLFSKLRELINFQMTNIKFWNKTQRRFYWKGENNNQKQYIATSSFF